MTDILAEGRTKAEAYNRDGDGFQNLGRKNAYVCDGGYDPPPGKEGCGSFIVTVDRDYGVTPFSLQCGNCGAFAYSKMYRIAEWLEPTHEWYRPESLDGVDPAYHQHLSNGGIILRPINGGEDRWLTPHVAARKANEAKVAELHAKLKAAEREAKIEAPQHFAVAKKVAWRMSRQERRFRARKGKG